MMIGNNVLIRLNRDQEVKECDAIGFNSSKIAW